MKIQEVEHKDRLSESVFLIKCSGLELAYLVDILGGMRAGMSKQLLGYNLCYLMSDAIERSHDAKSYDYGIFVEFDIMFDQEYQDLNADTHRSCVREYKNRVDYRKGLE